MNAQILYLVQDSTFVLETPQGEYEFLDELLFADDAEYKSCKTDCIKLFHNIYGSLVLGLTAMGKAQAQKKRSSHYRIHCEQVIRFLNDLGYNVAQKEAE